VYFFSDRLPDLSEKLTGEITQDTCRKHEGTCGYSLSAGGKFFLPPRTDAFQLG